MLLFIWFFYRKLIPWEEVNLLRFTVYLPLGRMELCTVNMSFNSWLAILWFQGAITEWSTKLYVTAMHKTYICLFITTCGSINLQRIERGDNMNSWVYILSTSILHQYANHVFICRRVDILVNVKETALILSINLCIVEKVLEECCYVFKGHDLGEILSLHMIY